MWYLLLLLFSGISMPKPTLLARFWRQNQVGLDRINYSFQLYYKIVCPWLVWKITLVYLIPNPKTTCSYTDLLLPDTYYTYDCRHHSSVYIRCQLTSQRFTCWRWQQHIWSTLIEHSWSAHHYILTCFFLIFHITTI